MNEAHFLDRDHVDLGKPATMKSSVHILMRLSLALSH